MDLGILAQYGAIGLFAGLMYVLFRQSSQRDQERSDRALQREQERADRLEQKITDLTNYYNTTVIPALERSTTATTSAITFLTQVQEQKRVEDAVAQKDRDRRRDRENGN